MRFYRFLKELWRAKLLSKIQIFTWRLLINKLQTKVELERRNVTIGIHELTCLVCFKEEEDIMHIFFNCEVSHNV